MNKNGEIESDQEGNWQLSEGLQTMELPRCLWRTSRIMMTEGSEHDNNKADHDYLEAD